MTRGRFILPLLISIALLQATLSAEDDVTWSLENEQQFNGRKRIADYHPYYVIHADELGCSDNSKTIQWHFYNDEPLVEYHPDDEFLLNSSRVMDRWIRLSKQAPHTIKWEIQFSGDARTATVDEDGITVGHDPENNGIALMPDKQHTLVAIRAGKRLTVTIDDRPSKEIEVAADSRTPLRLAAQVTPVRLHHTRLWFGNGEKLAAPPPAKEGAPPKWEKVFSEDFSTEDSLKNFLVTDAANDFKWDKEAKALQMGPAKEQQIDDTFILLHKSLPGDMRLSFRARSMLKGQPAFFGVFVGLKGKLSKCDGYFIEWNYWQVQIKKRRTRIAGQEISYDNKDPNAWMKFSLEKAGSKITMYTEGKKVLTFEDDNPLKGSEHDLLSFYSWRVPMEFSDIVIERNALDPTVPRAEDPALPDSYLKGGEIQKPPVVPPMGEF